VEVISQLPYIAEALFAAVRIVFWFVLLFGLIGPLFLSHTRDQPNIEKLIYSWVGLGGIIVFSIFVLTVLHLYDFISIAVTLLLIPLIINIYRSDAKSVREYFEQWELKTLVRQLRIIENDNQTYWTAFKSKFTTFFKVGYRELSEWTLVLGIALAGTLIRMYPALNHAAPFNRGWFEHLNRVKELRLQDYFLQFPSPGGMHSLVSIFSMLTQVSPEMILHLLGALSSFFLCILVYWVARDLTKNRYPLAPIMGMSIYALVPMLFLPISLDQQVEASSLDLALCFAFPTITIFIRNLRSKFKSPWFYVLSGFIATAFINLFVAFIILLPLMFLGLLSLPRRRYLKSFYRVSGYLLSLSIIVLLPFLVMSYIQDISPTEFFLTQLYDIQAYTYFPSLVLPMDELSYIYILVAGILMLYFAVDYFVSGRKYVRDECIFLIIFVLVALRYTPLLDIGELFWIDTDQLNEFFAVLIGVFASITFVVPLEILYRLEAVSESVIYKLSWGLLLITIPVLIFVQGGIRVSSMLPSTVPNGFFKAYYKIISERLPYSYATVGPGVQRIQAKNRHYYMDYEYFLDEYAAIDSTYHQQLGSESLEKVPPASIFIFTEKAPYGSIQQGILYDSPSVMRDIEQWVADFQKLPDRKIKLFYEGPSTKVYEIVNRETDSGVGDILNQIYPRKKNQLFDE